MFSLGIFEDLRALYTISRLIEGLSTAENKTKHSTLPDYRAYIHFSNKVDQKFMEILNTSRPCVSLRASNYERDPYGPLPRYF